jgi:two-component system cell cycle sensor histidine kinase/response regulator CckA
MLGYPDREALLRINVTRIYADPAERSRFMTLMERQGIVSDFGTQFLREDGTAIWVRINARATRDAGGRVLCYEGSLQDITESRQAQEAQHMSEARYRAIVEDQTDLVCRFLLDGTITFVNEAYCSYFGKRRDELLGHNFLTLLPADERGSVQARFSALDQDNPVATYEHRELAADGQVHWVQWTDRAIFDGQGPLVEFQSVGRDVTGRKRAEEEIRRRTAHLEALNATIAAAAAAADLSALLETALGHALGALEMEMGGIWVAGQYAVRGLPGEFTLAMARAARADRAGRLEIAGPIAVEDWQEVAAGGPGSQDLELRSILGPVMGGLGVRGSLTVPVLAGERRVGGLSLADAAPRRWSGEEIALAEAIGRQLGAAAERLRLLEQVREQAGQMQQIMDTVPEGLILLDAERRIVLSNPAAQEYLAVLTEDSSASELTQLGDRLIEELLEVLPPPLYHEIRSTAGRPRVFEAVAQPVAGATGTAGWVLLLRDVTWERDKQARVEQQERLAAMGQLAAGIAHDFNNVLQGILSFAEVLRKKPDMPEAAQEPLGLICELARRAGQMNRQILDFSRQSVVEKRPLDLVAFTKEVVYLLQRTIPENIRVSLKQAPRECWVNADVAQLQQVLMNLAVNARDAMPGGGQLTLSLSHYTLERGALPPDPQMPAGEWVCLEVSDSGLGIPAEILPRVFEPFFTTKSRSAGTGLGLAQVYGIVKQHQGYIEVASEVGVGTTFTIYLPAWEEKEPAAFPRPEGDATGRGETILLVEDDAIVLQATTEALGQLGYRVLSAASGEQALSLYDQHRDEIALVLTDMVMPGMAGAALVQALRARDPDARIVVVTGYPTGKEAEALLAQGSVHLIQKPIQLARLAQVVGLALGEP